MLLLLTNSCSMDCPHCLNSSSPNGLSMEKSVLESAIQFLNNHEIVRLMIAGGEFTEHPRFKEFISRIANETQTIIIRGSNGIFILDERKKHDVEELLVIPNIIGLQITNIAKYYKRNDFMKSINPSDFKGKLYVETRESMISLAPLGRARTNFPNIKNVSKPACINFYSLPRQGVPTLNDIFLTVEQNTVFSFCKPLIAPNGDLLAGESLDCAKIGTIWDKDEKIWENLANNVPCNKCRGMENIDVNQVKEWFQKGK